MKKSNGGQSAIEFFILVGVLFFIFMIFLLIFQSNLSDKTYERQDTMIKETALTIQNELSLAAEASNGYLRTFELPLKILGSDYQANITSGFVYVRTTDGTHAISLPVQNVTGDLSIPTNRIIKLNETIYLNINP